MFWLKGWVRICEESNTLFCVFSGVGLRDSTFNLVTQWHKDTTSYFHYLLPLQTLFLVPFYPVVHC